VTSVIGIIRYTMKRFVIIIILSVVSLAWHIRAYGQLKPQPILSDPDYDFEKRLRFGFSLGVNFMDFQISSNQHQQDSLFVDNSRLYPGFNVNVVTDFRIIPTIHLRFLPGLAFGQRDLYFYNKDLSIEPTQMQIESSFIEMPLMVKYSAVRKWNTRPYLVAGANFRVDMAAYKKLNIEEGVYIRLIKGDIYYELGFGMDFFLTYFKFSTELKFSSGFRNAMGDFDPDQGSVYASAIGRLKSQLITLSFHFE
jgi:hypothetical protein